MNAEKWYDEQLPMDFHNAVLSRDSAEIWKCFKQWMLKAYEAGYGECHDLAEDEVSDITDKNFTLKERVEGLNDSVDSAVNALNEGKVKEALEILNMA